ncbi:PDZ11 protein, partial [Alaudala cheleensis]|nr:PDZ11 protein [Alaudala cheleensis]
GSMESWVPYDDFPVVFLPPYESPPAWVPPHERVYHPDYNNELTPQNILHDSLISSQPLDLLSGAVWERSCVRSTATIPALPSQVIPDSDAHRAGLQEGVQVLSVNDVDFQDIEHSKAVEIRRTAREITMCIWYFPYSKCPVLECSLE